MFTRITLWNYLKVDLKAAFLVFFSFLAFVVFVLVAILTTLMSDEGSETTLGEALAFGLGPLAAFALFLLDTYLLVRRINKAANQKQWVRGEVAKVTVRDDGVCLVTIVLDRKPEVRRKAFVSSGRWPQSFTEGSESAVVSYRCGRPCAWTTTGSAR